MSKLGYITTLALSPSSKVAQLMGILGCCFLSKFILSKKISVLISNLFLFFSYTQRAELVKSPCLNFKWKVFNPANNII